jgi:hypothetical protein
MCAQFLEVPEGLYVCHTYGHIRVGLQGVMLSGLISVVGKHVTPVVALCPIKGRKIGYFAKPGRCEHIGRHARDSAMP